MTPSTKSIIEHATLAWLEDGDLRGTHGPENRDTLQRVPMELGVPDAERIVERAL